jgi:hypothetical protein
MALFGRPANADSSTPPSRGRGYPAHVRHFVGQTDARKSTRVSSSSRCQIQDSLAMLEVCWD